MHFQINCWTNWPLIGRQTLWNSSGMIIFYSCSFEPLPFPGIWLIKQSLQKIKKSLRNHRQTDDWDDPELDGCIHYGAYPECLTITHVWLKLISDSPASSVRLIFMMDTGQMASLYWDGPMLLFLKSQQVIVKHGLNHVKQAKFRHTWSVIHLCQIIVQKSYDTEEI